MNTSVSCRDFARTCSLETSARQSRAASSGAQTEDRRRRGEEAPDAGGGSVLGLEVEGRLVTEPARKRVGGRLLVLAADVQISRGTGAAVQVLVATADGEIHPVRLASDDDRPCRVAQVPERDRTHGVSRGREERKVEHLTGR